MSARNSGMFLRETYYFPLARPNIYNRQGTDARILFKPAGGPSLRMSSTERVPPVARQSLQPATNDVQDRIRGTRIDQARPSECCTATRSGEISLGLLSGARNKSINLIGIKLESCPSG